MKNPLVLLVVGGLLALTAGCPPASPTGGGEMPAEKGKPNKEPASAETTIAGAVTKVDAEKKLITVQFEGDRQMTFTVGADARITLDAKEATIADLKVGQTIVVTARGPDASTIVAVSPK